MPAENLIDSDVSKPNSNDTSYGSDDSLILPQKGNNKSGSTRTGIMRDINSEPMDELISGLHDLSQRMGQDGKYGREQPSTSRVGSEGVQEGHRADGRASREELSVRQIKQCMEVQQDNERRESLEKLIMDAERARAEIYKPTGKRNLSIVGMDDDFFHHSSHLDNTLIQKIVDLEKLLPKDKILHNDGRLQMVQTEGGGYMHLKPVTEKDPLVINSLRRWEQAFKIYVTIYTAAHPHCSSELFKHMYNIRSATSTFTWDNVYNYDITFRRLMAQYPD